MLQFIDEAQLDRVGCFAYSAVEGAAANALPDPVPEAVKEERRAQLMERQADISAERLAARIGTRMTVLVDEVNEDGAIARSYADAPEIDGVVVIEMPGKLQAGDKVEVSITDSGEYDLWAELLP